MELKASQVKLFVMLVMLALAFLVIKPYIITIIVAAIAAYLLWPLHKHIKSKIGDFTSALLLTSSSLVVVLLAMYYGINLLIEESTNFYRFLSEIDLSYFGPVAQDIARLITTKLVSIVSEQIVTIMHIIIAGVIFFVSLFYFLKEGPAIYKEIVSNMPFESDHKKKLIKNITHYLDAFIHVQVVIGVIQGILAAIGFWFFGLPYPILAGVAAGVLSILPGIGPYVLYIPVGLAAYYMFGFSTAVGIIVYGLTLGSIMDYLVRPFFYGKRVRMHPLIIFLGIFGGIEFFGFVGIIIGPIILSIAIALFKELEIKK